MASIQSFKKFFDTSYYKMKLYRLSKHLNTEYLLLDEIHHRKNEFSKIKQQNLDNFCQLAYPNLSDLNYSLKSNTEDFWDVFRAKNLENFISAIEFIKFEDQVESNLTKLKSLDAKKVNKAEVNGDFLKLINLIEGYHSSLFTILKQKDRPNYNPENNQLSFDEFKANLGNYQEILNNSKNTLDQIAIIYTDFILKNYFFDSRSINILVDAIEYVSFSNRIYILIQKFINQTHILSSEMSIWCKISFYLVEKYSGPGKSKVFDFSFLSKHKKDRFKINYISDLYSQLVCHAYLCYERLNIKSCGKNPNLGRIDKNDLQQKNRNTIKN